MTRPGRHNGPLNLVLLAALLRTSVKEVHEPDLAEHERQNCPTSFNLTPSPKGFGEARLPSRPPTGVFRPLRRCRAPHADGAVAEEIDTIEHSIRVINVVYIVLSMHLQRTTAAVAALPVHDSWRFVGTSSYTDGWRPAPPRASCHCGVQPSRSLLALRLVLQLAHFAFVVHHRAPTSVQSPRLSCCARGAREAVCRSGGAHRGARNRPK